MDSFLFYKSLYDRELARRIDLDNALNIPLTVLSIIVAANAYMMEDLGSIYSIQDIRFAHWVFLFLSPSLAMSIFYMMRSSNNLLKGFAYKNCALASKIRKYEEQIEEYNLKTTNSKANFEALLIVKLNEWTDDHMIFNDKRSNDLRKSRAFLALSLIMTAMNFFHIILQHLKL